MWTGPHRLARTHADHYLEKEFILDGAHNPGRGRTAGPMDLQPGEAVQACLRACAKRTLRRSGRSLAGQGLYHKDPLYTDPGSRLLGDRPWRRIDPERVRPFADLKAAVDVAARTPGTTIICGSLYLIGAVLEYIELLKRS